MVEIGHQDLETLVFLANQVLHRHLDVFESNVRGSARPHTLTVHATSADALMCAFDQEDGHAVHAFVAGTDSGGEVVAPDAVGDPFLLA